MSKKKRKAVWKAPPRSRIRVAGWISGAAVALAAVVALLVWADAGSTETANPQRAKVGRSSSPFDGARAFRDLERVVAIGPRVPGTEGSRQVQALIRAGLEEAGLEVREQAFTADTPLGPREMVNLTGVVRGTEPGIIILSNHYDTKYFPDFRFVGANDSGSTTAWMLEMARVLGPERSGLSIWLVFFDGEEAFGEWSPRDSLYGSRAYVEKLQDKGQLEEVKALVNVDMIGDCFLGIQRDADAPAWLQDTVWRVAEEQGYGDHFLSVAARVQDDHIPFRNAGVPALELIDFTYGRSFLEHRLNWHTPQDTLDKVCPESLQVVGDVIYHALPEIEAQARR